MPPCLSLRDWYESGKSSHSDHAYRLPYLPTPVSPFHAEPLHTYGATWRRSGREARARQPFTTWSNSTSPRFFSGGFFLGLHFFEILAAPRGKIETSHINKKANGGR